MQPISAESPHILVVDDDDRLRNLLMRYLCEQGFAVSQAADAAQARKLLEVFQFDLAVLDVMMPGESGLSLAGTLNNTLPVLMLSALGETENRLEGLEVGVDDYMAKPFEPKELVLRIRAILRRAPKPSETTWVTFGDYRFDTARQQLHGASGVIYLTSAEATLLSLLARAPNEAVSREALARGLGIEPGNERGVDVQVTRLRKKIEAEEGRPQHIQTVRGAGYQLTGTRA